MWSKKNPKTHDLKIPLSMFFICLSVDACDGSVTIDDMQWCHNCPGKLWDASGNGGSGSCDDISTECDDLNTVADADRCYACGMRGVAETSWDGATCAGIDCGKSFFTVISWSVVLVNPVSQYLLRVSTWCISM